MRLRALLSVLAIGSIGLVGCGNQDGEPTAAPTTIATAGPVTVFAAASLTEAFESQKAAHSDGLDITYSFAGSGSLVTQITEGAPADVVATADADSMEKLVSADLVESPATFARNKLEILVAPGNPKAITGLADLARSDVAVVLGDTTVPAGKYARTILNEAGIEVSPKSLEADVKSAVAKVTSGEADATIVYATDVTAAGERGEGVTITDDQNIIATYPIAVVKSAQHRAAAEAFVQQIVSGTGQDALATHGFLPAQ